MKKIDGRTLFRNKYRIESTRLKGWDYGDVGYYFVTICTKNRACFFGDVVGDAMMLSQIGEIVAEEWVATGMIRPNITLDQWIIMPNHIHLILIITHKIASEESTVPLTNSQTKAASEAFSANTLGSIIGQFKSLCTKRIRASGIDDFAWQPRFYDRIIRTEQSLLKAREYILNNPPNWHKDQNNPNGLYM